jgi:regulator of sirC expression with transglutaminase-like and TPR domain
MSLGPHLENDREFAKLLSRRRDVDVTVAALELARDAYPDIDMRETLDWIVQRADELSGPVALARNERDALGELGRCLAGRHGIRGDAECGDNAESSYLPRVIATRRGIPISISLLYMAVGARVGLELAGVNSPGHFLTRYESCDGPLFVDGYSEGRILSYDQSLAWISDLTDQPHKHVEPLLKSTDPRTIIIRMLRNLKIQHALQKNWDRAWRVQKRLALLNPASFDERRDLAIITLRADRPGRATDLLNECLRNCPEEEREQLQSHLNEARRLLSHLN